MSIWNGSIAPWVQKSIGTVRFVPLKAMTTEMWRVLDYENLRETAKNKLAEKARDGIIGFFDVNIVEKAGPAKPRYFLPVVTSKEVETWESEGGAPAGFENSEDVEDLTTEAQELDRWVDRISGAILGGIAAGVVAKHLAENTEASPQAPEEEGGESFDGYQSPTTSEQREIDRRLRQNKDDWQAAQELTELAESGSLDNLDDIDAALMIALYLFDKYPLAWLESLIDELESAQDEF